MSEQNPLASLVQKHFEQDIVAASANLELLDIQDAREVLNNLPLDLSIEVLKQLQVRFASSLLPEMGKDFCVKVMSSLEPQAFAAIYMHLPADKREALSASLPDDLKDKLREALTYPEDSIGRNMSTDFLSFNKDITVHQAIENIRSLAKNGFPASYIYVVDSHKTLVGVVNMRDLMLAMPDDRLEKVMRKNVFALHAFMDQEEAANELTSRRFFAAPVVDSQNHIVGIIKAEQLIAGMQEEATEDFQIMFGAGGNERPLSPVRFSVAKRLPWLHVNLVTAFLAAGVVALFQDLIAQITILAVFLPIIAGQGGNAGAQSLAVCMRGLVMREIPSDKMWPLIAKEGMVGTINGIVIGLVTAAAAILWDGNPYMGLVIGLGMLVNMIVAGLAGAGIPLLMKAMKFDPAQSSNIILTTVTDVMGFFAFLGFALLFKDYLIAS